MEKISFLDVFSNSSLDKRLEEILDKFKSGDSSCNDYLNTIFDYIEYLPSQLIELIENNDDFLEPLFLYRFPKAILGALFNILLKLDNQITAVNSCVNKGDLTFKFSGSAGDANSHGLYLIFNRLDNKIFKFIKGMEFDLEAQLNFMELFNASYKILQTNKVIKENELEAELKNLIRILKDDFIDIFTELFFKLNRLKNRIFDTGVQTIAGKNAEFLLNKYAYIQYEFTSKVTLKELTGNNSREIINKERIKCFYKYKKGHISSKNEPSVYKNWKAEYEYKIIQDGGIISIKNSEIVTVETEIIRTTGIQELLKKSLEMLANERLAEKAGSTQWGMPGAEAGGFADKLILTFLCSRYESEPVLPTPNLNICMYQHNLNKKVIDRYASKYVLNQEIQAGTIALEFPKTEYNATFADLDQSNGKVKFEFVTICGIK